MEFEGAYQVTDCWVNGEHIGQHSIGGYTPFHFEITDAIDEDGTAEIVLRVDNRYNENIPPDFGRHDYIMPGGLYRDVYLVRKPRVHFTFPWESTHSGVYITTPELNENIAKVSVLFELQNLTKKRVEGHTQVQLLDQNQNVVAANSVPFNLASSDRKMAQVELQVDQPKLWSINSPNLYHARLENFFRSTVKPTESDDENSDGNEFKPGDQVVERFGIRKLELSKEKGICLNGKPIELIGANRHQQYPYIGNAVPDNLHYYDMWIFKQAGLNCVRLSHYPQDNAILDACDELGLLVTEEPPTWIDVGGEIWIKNLEAAQRRLIRNHRNHPSLFMWAVGINHLGFREYLQVAAEQEDPTRWTHSNSAEWGESAELKKGRADIHGEMGFKLEEIKLKDDVQFTIEHSRGDRGRKQIASAIRRPEHLGLCVWQGFDNHSLKRKTRTQKIERSGALDMYRNPKEMYRWYQTEFLSDPLIHINNRQPNADEPVVVFSNCEELELTVNGATPTRRKPDSEKSLEGLQSPPFTFEQKWTEGQLVVEGFIGGQSVLRVEKNAPGTPNHLTIDFGLAENDMEAVGWKADGVSILPVYVRIRDKNGSPVPNCKNEILLEIEGEAEIVGDGQGVGANPVTSRDGYAPFLLKARPIPSRIRITAKSDGLLAGEKFVDLE